MAEKRVSERVSTKLVAEVVREEAFECVSTEVVDVSRGGLRVRTNARVLTGEDVLLTVTLGGRQLDAHGYVARVVHGRRTGETGERYLGLRFTYLDEPSQHALDTWLAKAC